MQHWKWWVPAPRQAGQPGTGWHTVTPMYGHQSTAHDPKWSQVVPDLSRPVPVVDQDQGSQKMCENSVQAVAPLASTDWFWWPAWCQQQHAIYVGSWLWLASEIFQSLTLTQTPPSNHETLVISGRVCQPPCGDLVYATTSRG